MRRADMHQSIARATRRRQQGIGLIEVLLAVVLLSIGFLASARMQVEGMRAAQSANAMSQAKFMLLDMSERMRANRQGIRDGNYDGMSTSSGTALPSCVSDGSACSPADIATADLHLWSRYLYAGSDDTDTHLPLLPSSSAITARGTIALDAPSGAHRVTVFWSELVDGSSVERSLSVMVFP